MSKGIKIVSGVLGTFLVIAALHVWLNIGFEKIGFNAANAKRGSIRVGFLPVT